MSSFKKLVGNVFSFYLIELFNSVYKVVRTGKNSHKIALERLKVPFFRNVSG